MTSQTTVRLSQILEVWESFGGWYWYVTERHEGSLAFGLVRGFETEWGYFDLDELRELELQFKVWKVPQHHWTFCPCVVADDAASFSRETGTGIPVDALETEQLKGGARNMSEDKKPSLEGWAPEPEPRDSILLCWTKAGNGLKVAHNGVWYYASRHKVLEVVNRKKENCLFVTIDDEAEPASSA